jgi:two-component system, OmpR family, response regulator
MTRNRIVYVDDEADIREIAMLALELDPDFDVKTCASGGDVLDLVTLWQPDLILLDCIMPGLDGPETLQRLRRSPQAVAIPVAFVTARTQSHEVAKLFALGATGIVPKPFDAMTLAATVKRFLPA